jgi:hypothetical protein
MEFGAHSATKDSGSPEGLKRWCPPGRLSGPFDHPLFLFLRFTKPIGRMDSMADKVCQSQVKESTPIRSRPEFSLVPHSYFTPNPMVPFYGLQNMLGNQATRIFLQPGSIQTKLTVGEPDDLYEQEADRVADKVMRMTDTSISGQRSAVDEVQRKPG